MYGSATMTVDSCGPLTGLKEIIELAPFTVEGTITLAGVSPKPLTYNAGDLFFDPPSRQGLIYRNLAGKVTATLLMFHVSDPKAPLQNPPMMPYVAIQEPTFIKASQASFAQDNDLVIGVASTLSKVIH